MTNGWVDIKNTDVMLIMGGNPAENHPCGFKWVVEAKKVRNAKLIVVDPRFQRTASQADHFCQIRAGTDIAFLGGLINYAFQNNRYAKEYVTNYTNAALIVKKGFKLPEDGLFSGFDAAALKYDVSSWNYEEGGNVTGTAAAAIAAGDGPATAGNRGKAAPANPAPKPQVPAVQPDRATRRKARWEQRPPRALLQRHHCQQTRLTISLLSILVAFSS